jgi:hypothetical protein
MMWRSLVLVALPFLALGCGASPTVLEAPLIDEGVQLDPWHAIDESDVRRVRMDLRRLRILGWMSPVRDIAEADTLFAVDGEKIACGLDFWNDIDSVAMSTNAKGELIGAFTSPIDISSNTCASKLVRYGDVWLLGQGERLVAAKIRLAEAAVSKLAPDTLVAAKVEAPQLTIDSLEIVFSGDDDEVELRMEVVSARQRDSESASTGVLFKKHFTRMAANVRQLGPAADPLAAALENPEAQLTMRGVSLILTLQSTPALRRLMSESRSLFNAAP